MLLICVTTRIGHHWLVLSIIYENLLKIILTRKMINSSDGSSYRVGPRVGKYVVTLESFERIALPIVNVLTFEIFPIFKFEALF